MVKPDLDTVWPRYSTVPAPKEDLSGLILRLCSLRRVKAKRRCCRWVGWSLEAAKRSSRYLRMNGKPAMTFSMSLQNEAGAPVRPMVVTLHCHCPKVGRVKAVYGRESLARPIW